MANLGPPACHKAWGDSVIQRPPSPLELLHVGLQGVDLGLYGLDRPPPLEELLPGGAVVPQSGHPGGPALRGRELPAVRKGEDLGSLCQ